MTDGEREQVKAWVEAWKRAGPLLERIRHEELRRLRHEDSLEVIDGLLQMGYQHGRDEPTSGLVEQQRVFMKARE
ncbi:MAG: hypothetical protein ACODAJ_00360 [Planctomycetota bacterium]